MGPLNKFLLMTGIKSTLGAVAYQFAMTFGEQVLGQLQIEHQEMIAALSKNAGSHNMASA